MTQTEPRILIVVSDFPKVTETFVLANAMHYAKQGHGVGVFHLKPFRKDELVHPNAAHIVARGFTFGWLDRHSIAGCLWGLTRPRAFLGGVAKIVAAHWKDPKRLASSLALVPKTCAMARRAKQDGVGHIHAEFAGYPATSAWLAARLSGIPFSFSAHAHDIFLTQDFLVEKAKSAEFVRVISLFNHRFLSALPGFPTEKLQVLRCGVTVSDTLPLPVAPSSSTPMNIVFVGALLPRKGVDLLLQAVSKLPKDSFTLDIIGGGSQGSHLQTMVSDIGLSGVVFHGPQPSSKVRNFMSRAHVVVVPSRETSEGRSEGIPVVLMEALSLSRPVISTRLSGIPELVEHGVTGLLCDPDDVNGLADALRDVSTNYDVATGLGRAGRARIEDQFNIEMTAEQLRLKIMETDS